MPQPGDFQLHRLRPEDVAVMHGLLDMFGEAFGEPETYGSARPAPAYLRRLLGDSGFTALAAVRDGRVIGGLAAYELVKFEQERSEIYIYDLAVAAEHRRRGIATTLIGELRRLAAERGAYVIFIQADRGDEPAVALYSKLGRREEVLHFDIAPDPPFREGGTLLDRPR